MRDYLRSLSTTTEFVIVIVGAFGLFISGSVYQALLQPTIDASDAGFGWLLGYELALLALLGSFLHVRGWTPGRLGLGFHARDWLVGAVLMVAVMVAYNALAVTASLLFPLKRPVISGTTSVNLMNFVTLSVVNPIFEEVFVCGYVVTTLRKSRGAWTAINASTTIRLLYHLYQGAFGVIGIVPTGLIFAWWFASTGRLWPAIFAHGLLNLIALVFGQGT